MSVLGRARTFAADCFCFVSSENTARALTSQSKSRYVRSRRKQAIFLAAIPSRVARRHPVLKDDPSKCCSIPSRGRSCRVDKSISKLTTSAALGLAMLGAPALSPAGGGAAEPTVVFVCEHGSSRSLLAASLFNQMAEERGLSARALSRAASEKTADQSVPAPLAKQMTADGFQVEGFRPRALTASEAAAATRIVTLQFDEAVEAANEAPVERWSDIGSPSREYAATKGTIASHIRALLDELKGGADRSTGKQE